jgi:hypothetical protein
MLARLRRALRLVTVGNIIHYHAYDLVYDIIPTMHSIIVQYDSSIIFNILYNVNLCIVFAI